MTREQFLIKYDLSIHGDDGFLDIYVRRWDKNKRLIKIWNPVKLLNMCKDIPLKWMSEDFPKDFVTLRHLMSALEDRIEYEREHRKDYYKYQIKPFLKDGIKY